jgi:hypothetical protein
MNVARNQPRIHDLVAPDGDEGGLGLPSTA